MRDWVSMTIPSDGSYGIKQRLKIEPQAALELISKST